MPDPTITLSFLNSPSEITWAINGIDSINEIGLIVINSDTNEISRFQLTSDSNTLALLSLDINLDVDNKIFIEIVSGTTSYSSNMLFIPGSLKTPEIIIGDGSYNILEQNKRVIFYVKNIDSRATYINVIQFDASAGALTEIINIGIPSAVENSIEKQNINIVKQSGNVYKFLIANLTNNYQYRFALYVSTIIGDIEQESVVSNTLGYLEPNNKPTQPYINSVDFSLNNPHGNKFDSYTFLIEAPDNCSEYTITEVMFTISDNSGTLVSQNNILGNLTYANGTSLPANKMLANSSLLKYTTTLSTLNVGTVYAYKCTFKNSEPINSLSVDSNTIKIKYCSVPTIASNKNFTITQQSDNTLLAGWDSGIINYSGSGDVNYKISSPTKTYSDISGNNYSIIDIVYGNSYTFTLNSYVKNIINNVKRDNTVVTSNLSYIEIGTISNIIARTTIIVPPTNLKAFIYDNGFLTKQINTEWNASTNASLYNVDYIFEYANDASFNNIVGTENICDTNYTLLNLAVANTYYFRVKSLVNDFPNEYQYNTSSESVNITTASKASVYVSTNRGIQPYEAPVINSMSKFTVEPKSNNKLNVNIDDVIISYSSSGTKTFKIVLYYDPSCNNTKTSATTVAIDVSYGTIYDVKLSYFIDNVITAVYSGEVIANFIDTSETEIGIITDITAYNPSISPPASITTTVLNGDNTAPIPNTIKVSYNSGVTSNLGVDTLKYKVTLSPDATFVSSNKIESEINSLTEIIINNLINGTKYYTKVETLACQVTTDYTFSLLTLIVEKTKSNILSSPLILKDYFNIPIPTLPFEVISDISMSNFKITTSSRQIISEWSSVTNSLVNAGIPVPGAKVPQIKYVVTIQNTKPNSTLYESIESNRNKIWMHNDSHDHAVPIVDGEIYTIKIRPSIEHVYKSFYTGQNMSDKDGVLTTTLFGNIATGSATPYNGAHLTTVVYAKQINRFTISIALNGTPASQVNLSIVAFNNSGYGFAVNDLLLGNLTRYDDVEGVPTYAYNVDPSNITNITKYLVLAKSPRGVSIIQKGLTSDAIISTDNGSSTRN